MVDSIANKPIFVMGDFHIGNKNYRGDLLKKTLDKILALEKASLILMGDYCEFINQKTYGYEDQIMTPKEQFKEFKKLMKPFTKFRHHNILAVLKGNHEDRYFKKLDMLEMWCEHNNICYYGRHGVVKIYRRWLYIHHPQSSATTTAGRSTVFRRMRDVQEADIYLTGHFHSLFQEKSHRYNRERELIDIHFGCTGSYLEYKNSYAEQKLYSPNPIGCKKITISKGNMKQFSSGKITMEDFI